MKKILLLGFLLAVMPGFAQSSNLEKTVSVLDEDLVWTMAFYSPYQEDNVSYIELKLDGEILIEGIVYKEIFQREFNQNEIPQNWKTTECKLGQDRGMIYYCDVFQEPKLLMDFSALEGDSIPYYLGGMATYLRVENVTDTVFVYSSDKQTRKCVYVKDIGSDENDVWVEGIGSLKYGIEPFFMEPITGGVPLLIRCTKNNEILYEHPNATIILDVSSPYIQDIVSFSATYDLQGRRLTGKPAKGLYIQNGRKMIAK